MNQRDALYYVMTGETFDGKRAAQIGLVNESVPRKKLEARTTALAKVLMQKNPTVLRQAKTAFRYASRMGWDEAADYLFAKSDQSTFMDPERGREEGMRQFLDEKSYKPGLGAYKRKR
jgi:trans-feruloyl-CoA hydratase/vanillin synthase